MPSLVAEIGLCLSKHFDYIDYLNNGEKQPIEPVKEDPIQTDEEEPQYPPNATICPESSCRVRAVVMMDGCPVCLSCGASKCS
jgi:hypothetical protein